MEVLLHTVVVDGVWWWKDGAEEELDSQRVVAEEQPEEEDPFHAVEEVLKDSSNVTGAAADDVQVEEAWEEVDLRA